MDNINIIRVGFFAPEVKLPDSDGEIDDPIDRSGSVYTCLVFINADNESADLMNKLESGLPKTASGMEIMLSAILPGKMKIAKTFKGKSGFHTRLFCDSELRFGKAFSVVDSSKAKPFYHPMLFVIGDEGSVRYRQSYGIQEFNIDVFRSSLSRLI